MIAGVLLGAVLLLWPALLNGYPLVFIDTAAYLAQTVVPEMTWDKPMAYGPFLFLGHWGVTLWGAVALQGLVMSWLLWRVQAAAIGRITLLRHLALVAGLAALTSLPWFTATLMPDVMAGVVVLTLWLLGVSGRGQRWAAGLLATVAIAVHLSHLVIAAAMIVTIALLTRRLAPVLRVAAPLAVALVFLVVSNGIGHGRYTLSPYGATFALARLQADGPATALLHNRCPEAGWYLCGFLDRLPMDSDAFLWDPHSPLAMDTQGQARPMGSVLIAPEAAEIVAATITAYPWEVFRDAMANVARQLRRVAVGDTLGDDHLALSARRMVAAGFAGELADFDAGLQMRGVLPETAAPLLLPQLPVLLLSLMVALGWGWRGRVGSLLACVLVGLLANAAVTGALSKPHDRYQARIVWLLPLVAGLALAPRRSVTAEVAEPAPPMLDQTEDWAHAYRQSMARNENLPPTIEEPEKAAAASTTNRPAAVPPKDPSMLSRTDIQYAFRLILGREMEDERVITKFIADIPDITRLRKAFLGSDEFRAYIAKTDPRSTDFAYPRTAPNIETTATEEQLQRLIKHVEGVWTSLGSSEPYWSVLTHDKYKIEKITEHSEEFFNSGKQGVSDINITCARNRIDLSNKKTCFELGCGVGRVSIWLAEKFEKVIAADISMPHLNIAREIGKQAERTNISFLHLDKIDRIKTVEPFDFFFSVLVLQHNPPPIIRYLLENILGKLKPGGVAFFQIITGLKDYSFVNNKYPTHTTGEMEMHAFPQRDLFQLVDQQNCEIVEFRTDSMTSLFMASHAVLLRKK